MTCREHRVESVHKKDATQIARLWANGRQLNYVRWRIGAGPSAAIRRNGSLVAWGMTHADGSMAMLRVLEEHRGQGLARAITYTLAKRVIAWGLRPFLAHQSGNNASVSLRGLHPSQRLRLVRAEVGGRVIDRTGRPAG